MPVNGLLNELANAYKHPQTGEEDRNGNTRLVILQERFQLSPLRLQKLLVTAGVYEPVKDSSMYYEIARLHREGKSVKEIMQRTGLSSAAVSACLPYERVLYNADQLGEAVSDAAERKRRQRRREEVLKQNTRTALQQQVTDEAFWAALQEHAWVKFISTEGERFTYHMLMSRLPKKVSEKVLSVVTYHGGLFAFTYREVMEVLHEALERKASGTAARTGEGAASTYLYPLLVFFGILPGEQKKFVARRSLPANAVCCCCGRRADYTVRTYADLCMVGKEIEEERRSRWEPKERLRVELEEADHGCPIWEERSRITNTAIRAFDAEGERQFCAFCAQTIRMALEDGALPVAAAPEDFDSFTLDMAEAALQGYREDFPEGVRFIDRHDREYPAVFKELYGSRQNEAKVLAGSGSPFLYRGLDKSGVEHLFACYLQLLPQHAVFEAYEVHRLTGAGRLARREYTGTDYEFRTGLRYIGCEVENENKRQICIGFLELLSKIREALRNPALEWHKGRVRYSNMLDVCDRQCALRSSGEMIVENDGFLIDGIAFRGEELVQLAGVHEGSVLQFRVTDPTDAPLRAGEYLMPVPLSEKDLVADTVELLNMFSRDGRFFSERDEANFARLFEKLLLPKLKLYHESNPRGYGKLAGMQIIKRLRWIQGTEWQVEQVKEVVGGN
jgi:hypothetical protein